MNSNDQNASVRASILSYVREESPPGYAVLVRGPWGVGKTHLVKSVLDEVADKKVFVTLAGCDSVADFNIRILRGVYPHLSSRWRKYLGKFGDLVKGIPLVKGVMPDLPDYADLLESDVDAIYVFDDLERAVLPSHQALMLINRYVEESERRVLILANEDEILSGNNDKSDSLYKAHRAKVVGRTLLIRPDFDAAIEAFLSEIKRSDVSLLLKAHLNSIQEVYEQSNCQNLRALRQALADVAALTAAASERLAGVDREAGILIRQFLVLSLASKTGGLARHSLDSSAIELASALHYGAPKGGALSELAALRETHREVDFSEIIFSGPTLQMCIFDGHFDELVIEQELSRARLFTTPDSEPEWRVAWDTVRTDPRIVTAAIKRMEEKFANREYIVPGEILHVAAMRMSFAVEGLIPTSLDETVTQAHVYITDLLKAGRLEPLDPASAYREHGRSHGGLGYTQVESKHFKEFYAFVQEQRAAAFAEYARSCAQTLLTTLENDPEGFGRLIAWSTSGGAKWRNYPILSLVDPNGFVETVLSLAAEQQYQVLLSLDSRYEHGTLNKDLRGEEAWLREVDLRLTEVIKRVGHLDSHRLTKLRNWFILTPLEKLDQGRA